MNQLKIILPLLVLLMSPSLVLAQNKQGQGTQPIVVLPTGNRVQNQIETQNRGEDTQLEVKDEERANLEDGVGEGLEKRNQNALENMSPVAQQVQLLLQIRTAGVVGEQVRQIAQEQNQAQSQIQQELSKIEAKNSLTKKLFGPDYKAIKNINRQVEQNQLRIRKLEQLANQIQNQADATQIQATIQALIQQNTTLQTQIQDEERVRSLLGWLVRLFNQ